MPCEAIFGKKSFVPQLNMSKRVAKLTLKTRLRKTEI